MTEKELIELKEDIDEAKTEKSELDGQKKALMKRLVDEWKCKNIKEAEQYIKRLEEEVNKLDGEIATGLEELDKYEL